MVPTYNIAIVGATGAVGQVIIDVLQERRFPVGDIHLLASEQSKGRVVRFQGRSVAIESLEDFDFSNVQIAFFSAGGAISEKFVPKATSAGCICIDNTSVFRNAPDVPLVVPEVNPQAIAHYQDRKIIANPNCSTIQMMVALKPIYDAVGLVSINVATYQSVSGAGRSAITELAEQATGLLSGQSIETKVFPHQIAFNVIPQIDVLMDNGYCKEEMKMIWETHKLLDDNTIAVHPTTVRVPVMYGHSEAIHIKTQQPLTKAEAQELLAQAPGVELLRDDAAYPTAMTHGANSDPVFVGRVRQDLFDPCGLHLWVVADNIRKGAALNAVQIAEHLVEHKFYLT